MAAATRCTGGSPPRNKGGLIVAKSDLGTSRFDKTAMFNFAQYRRIEHHA